MGLPNNQVSVSYKLPYWEAFENSVWRLFIQMKFGSFNRDKFGIKVDESKYFGASGLFADDNIVFMTKVIYKAKTGGLDTSSSTLYGDISNWMDGFQDAAGFLQRQFTELENKKFVPLVVTRGYQVSQQEKEELREALGVYVINDRFVQELDRIAGKNGDFAKTVLCQNCLEVSHCRTSQTIQRPYGINRRSEGILIFANASEVVDTVYVHRRLPQDTGFAMAYQRMQRLRRQT